MISIIICSIHPEQVCALEKNITNTIGIPFELIVHDNREINWGLARVYNTCALKAKFDVLFFIHEDLQFNTDNWGIRLIEQIQQPECGVIGFAGSKIKCRSYSGWEQVAKYNYMNCVQHFKRTKKIVRFHISDSDSFISCITLDGMALMVRKKVWQEFPFDEKLLQGFHCYDLDFSLQVSQKYTNYVCNTIEIEHFSEGNFDTTWIETTFLFHKKWISCLPVYVGDFSKRELKENEEHMSYWFVRAMMKSSYPLKKIWPFAWKYIRKEHFLKHSGTIILKFIIALCGYR